MNTAITPPDQDRANSPIRDGLGPTTRLGPRPSQRMLAKLASAQTGVSPECSRARIRRGQDPVNWIDNRFRSEVPNTQAARRAWMHSLKGVPCLDCGRSFPPECMDFDHRNARKKKFNISPNWAKSIEVLKEEIAKCDVVCACCHRIRTKNRRKKKKC